MLKTLAVSRLVYALAPLQPDLSALKVGVRVRVSSKWLVLHISFTK